MSNRPLVFIVGPTAVGKSQCGLAAALATGAGILNCDSIQCYQKVEIGTAKPTTEERLKVPHFLLDWVSPPHVLTAGDFRRAVLEVLDEEWHQRPLIGVGGSGFYLQALWCGMPTAPQSDPNVVADLEREMREKGEAAMWERLRSADPEAAGRIHPHDHYRLLRALAVVIQTGKPVTWSERPVFGSGLPMPIRVVGLYMEKDLLRDRVRARTLSMLKLGWVEEVEDLIRQGHVDWWPLESVGYAQVVAYLAGAFPLEELTERIVISTMQLAKKQMTWLKRWPEIEWFQAEEQMVQAQEQVIRYVMELPQV